MSAIAGPVPRQILELPADLVWSDPQGGGRLHLFPQGRGERFLGSIGWTFKASACRKVTVSDDQELPPSTSSTPLRCPNCRRYAYRAGRL